MKRIDGPSLMQGMDIITDAGIGEHLSRGHGVTGVPARATDTASTWLARYAKRAAEATGLAVAAGGTTKDGSPAISLGGKKLKATLVMDGRTVLGLNKSVAGLMASGVSRAKATELAMNRLAVFRASKASDPKVVRAKRAKAAKKGRKS